MTAIFMYGCWGIGNADWWRDGWRVGGNNTTAQIQSEFAYWGWAWEENPLTVKRLDRQNEVYLLFFNLYDIVIKSNIWKTLCMPFKISSFITTEPSGIIFKISLTNCNVIKIIWILATEFVIFILGKNLSYYTCLLKINTQNYTSNFKVKIKHQSEMFHIMMMHKFVHFKLIS